MPRLEHVQLVDPADLGRFASDGIAASVQPVHVGSDAIVARRLWGDRAESNGYAWASLARTGAVVAFGTDAPIEPFDPVARHRAGGPARGSALAGRHAAVRAARRPCRWTARCGPHASIRRSPRARLDRGRLMPGHRADVVVLDASVLDDPVEPGGALANARPTMVLMDGEVVFER